jgi:hypothetical protein
MRFWPSTGCFAPPAVFAALPYPMRLGRKPIAIATMASIVATRMAAASISTSFSVAQSPDDWRLVPSMHLAATSRRADALALACAAAQRIVTAVQRRARYCRYERWRNPGKRRRFDKLRRSSG